VAFVDAGAVIASVASTCCGLLEAPFDVIVIGAVYVFVKRPIVFTVTVIASVSVVVVPEVGLRVNHEAASLALQLNVPFPGLVMFKV